MEPLARALHVVVPVLWTAAASAYVVVFVRDDAGAARWGLRLSVLAAAVHLAAIGAEAAAGAPPLLRPGALISGMGLATALVYLVLERRVGRPTIGMFALVTSALLATGGAAFGDPLAPPPPGISAAKTSSHVAAAILGYSGLLLGAIFGALLLAQQRALRGRSFGLFWERLPSIELLDQFTRGSLGAAALFLTVTIGLGHVTRHDSDRMGPYGDPKVIATNALWLLTVVAFLLRRFHRMRPSRAALASIVLFGLALANMTIVNAFSKVHEGV